MTIESGLLRPQSYFVLAALLDAPLHGYAILKRVADLSDGAVTLAAGTLYAALDRLTGAELVEVVREEVVNGRARRYYALTDRGEDAVRVEAARMAAAARVVTDRAQVRRVRPGRQGGGSAAVSPA